MSESRSLRHLADDIFRRTLHAIDVERVVHQFVRRTNDSLQIAGDALDLRHFSKVVVIGIGKAAVPMSRAIEEILGEHLTTGVIATNAVIGSPPTRVDSILGGHPVPNQASVDAARTAIRLLSESDSDQTLVIFLITGGGSSLFELPISPWITLDVLQQVNRALVGCGAVIGEMNVVRRHLSAVKGGRLADFAPRSRQITLYISDVNDDDLTTVASGPTLPADTSLELFGKIIDKYGLLGMLPEPVISLIKQGAIPPMPAPSRNDKRTHHLLLDNRQALEAAAGIAREFGFATRIESDLVEGEVEAFAQTHLDLVEALWLENDRRPVALLSGGEVICPVRGPGSGGRNQEFVLRAALNFDLQAGAEIAVLSAGTDGIDGNSPAAGAIADAATISSAEARGFAPRRYLEQSDSYSFFSANGGEIVTGPTGNNVRDLRLLLRR